VEITEAQLWLLRDAGLISDNCAGWDEVAECDKVRAIEYLKMIDPLRNTPKCSTSATTN
jgi:hypothetical protein